MNDLKVLKELAKLAATGNSFRARHAAGIVHRGELVATGINQRKTHPFHQRFAFNSHTIYLHAETDCIKNALSELDVEDLTKSTLYVIRLRSVDWGLSKPCLGCERAILTFGIPKIVYTTDGYGFIKITLDK